MVKKQLLILPNTKKLIKFYIAIKNPFPLAVSEINGSAKEWGETYRNNQQSAVSTQLKTGIEKLFLIIKTAYQ